jgi:hypothetical protein
MVKEVFPWPAQLNKASGLLNKGACALLATNNVLDIRPVRGFPDNPRLH